MQANPYPLRVDKVVMDKFKAVAADHGRSVNKEIEALMKEAILQFESQHGEIPVQDLGE